MQKHFSRPVLVAAVALAIAVPAMAQVGYQLDPRPKTYVTDFGWYKPNLLDSGRANNASLACTRAEPRYADGEIAATDYLSTGGYYADKYRRFRSAGVDGIALMLTDRLGDSFAGNNLELMASHAVDAGLEIFAYYDLIVATFNESNIRICFPGQRCPPSPGISRIRSYDLARYGALRFQWRNAFERIAERLILPHLDSYAFLEDQNGNQVLDEQGLPRPIIAFYVPRILADNTANYEAVGELLEGVTEHYRNLGLGRPAMLLDVIFWGTATGGDPNASFDPALVDAFGANVVGLTWYGFFDTYRAMRFNISNDGRSPMPQWAVRLSQQYRKARAELIAQNRSLMIWPGVSTQIDTRVADAPGCRERGGEVVYHARRKSDWRKMFASTGQRNAWVPIDGVLPKLQTAVIVTNAGEWFEAGGIDDTEPDRFGECSYPYNWCTQNLDVIRQEDRH